ncbi:MAG: glucose-1-phosphate thymidylyltransferase [Deltaproteobacteria bacterium]|jgi:NDP-sugar pyrophosphorylase family protein|nr:glucose-1-phosphate thymidylyltransferase [Deltaproteobacteria bacterium]
MSWYAPQTFFKLPENDPLEKLFSCSDYVWDALDNLKTYIRDQIKPNVETLRARGSLVTQAAAIIGNETVFDVDWRFEDSKFVVSKDGAVLDGAALVLPGAFLSDDDLEIGEGVLVETGAMLKGPSIIGRGTEVRQGAYVRGSVLSGEKCIIGHATEAKNVLMLSGAKAGHFAYLGDSIIGSEVNLGAGAKLANLKMLQTPYRFKVDDQILEVNRRKFGAILGDRVETGCNSVTSPGVLMGPDCKLLPNVTAKGGYYPRKSLLR